MDFSDYINFKLNNSTKNTEIQEVIYLYDSIKLVPMKKPKSKFQSDFAIINCLGIKLNYRDGSRAKFQKILVKLVAQAITMSNSIILLVNHEISISDVPEIFEKAMNNCLKL